MQHYASICVIESRLNVLGYTNLKQESSKTISILTDENRVDVLEDVASKFCDMDAKYDPDKGSSSIGAVTAGIYTIKARPASKQGKNSAGLANEDAFINNIKHFTKDRCITVKISCQHKKQYIYENVVDVEEVGRDTSNRKKADVRLVLHDGTKVPISIKKDNAEMWESADSYYAESAKRIVDLQESLGTIAVEKTGSVYRIAPNIAVRTSKEEKSAVVFGSDLLGHGFVAVRTFRKSDFELSECGNVLNVNVSKIIDSVDDLTQSNDIFFLIRNDSSRKGSKIRPGLRVLAVSGTRINKKVKVF